MNCILFDLDGTLADTRHRIHYIKFKPRDWNAFFDGCVRDITHQYVERLYRILQMHTAIIICTGRPESHRPQSEQWLAERELHYELMLMRPNRDYRPDYELKLQMLQQLRADGWTPMFAIEDRSAVVNMYRNNGVPVFQVEDSTVD